MSSLFRELCKQQQQLVSNHDSSHLTGATAGQEKGRINTGHSAWPSIHK